VLLQSLALFTSVYIWWYASASASIGAFITSGLLRPDVAEIFTLDQTARAHEAVEAGAPANIVVSPKEAT